MINSPRFCVFEIGASGWTHRTLRPEFEFDVEYVGFEPAEDCSIEEIVRMAGLDPSKIRITYESIVASDVCGETDFNVYKNPKDNTCYYSSILDLDGEEILRLKEMNLFKDSKTRVPTLTLDEYSKRKGIFPDSLIIDAQGAGLTVLRGSEELLKNSVNSVIVEAEFLKLYKQQSLFGDVFNYLFEMDFRLVRFEKCGSGSNGVSTDAWAFSNSMNDALLAWSDCYFVRNPKSIIKEIGKTETRESDKIFKYLVSCYFMNCFSLALEVVRNFGTRERYFEHKRINNRCKWDKLEALIFAHLNECDKARWEIDASRKIAFTRYREELLSIIK